MSSFLGSIALAFQQALLQLREGIAELDVFEDQLAQIGWQVELEDSLESWERLQDYLEQEIVPLYDTVEDTVIQMRRLPDDGLGTAIELLSTVGDLIEKIQSLREPPSVSVELPPPLNDTSFWENLPLPLLDYLVARYLEDTLPLLFGVLNIFDIIHISRENPQAAHRIPYEKYTFNWDRVGDVIVDPAKALRETYGWAGNPFKHGDLFTAIERLFLLTRVPVRLILPRTVFVDRYYPSGVQASVKELDIPLFSSSTLGYEITSQAQDSGYLEVGLILLPVPVSAGDTNINGLLLSVLAVGYAGTAINLGRHFNLLFAGGFDATGAAGVELFPQPTGVRFAPWGQPELTARIALIGSPPQPWRVLSDGDLRYIAVDGVYIAISFKGTVADPELLVDVATGEGDTPPPIVVHLSFADSDDFLGSFLSKITANFELRAGLRWSSKTGFSSRTDVGFRIDIPINKTLGPVEFQSAAIGLGKSGSDAALMLGLTGALNLGPIRVTIDGVGTQFKLRLLTQQEPVGLIGNRTLAFGFKQPYGLGIRIDVGPVKGGGYISFDADNGRYAGVLQLDLAGVVNVVAIGLLDTRVPGGGYSFLIIITARFPPIQLGFGLTLNGVGGLVGIQRGVEQQALQDGVRAGAVDSILFPTDPLSNPVQLINNVRAIFPVRAGQYVFGPFVILAWGTPTIIEAQLGIILELPIPLVIILLGQMDIYLPKKEAAVVELHLDVAGILDFTNSRLSIDASLHDSRIGIFTISGDMALRIAWGNQPTFALSVGGFNPAYLPPPGFPTLRRLTLSLGDNPHLSIAAYFALTTNTLQFGVHADLYASAEGFEIRGWLHFDALFIFDPFSFRIDITVGVSVSKWNKVLLEIRLELLIVGPRPWQISGVAIFNVVFEFKIPIRLQIGENVEDDTRAKNPLEVLKNALLNTANWSVALPENIGAATPADTTSGNQSPLDPVGTLVVRQRDVPLDKDINILVRPLSETQRLTVTIQLGGQTVATSSVQDYFAPAQFREMSNEEKLSSPSFDLMDSGLSVTLNNVKSDAALITTFDYKVHVENDPDPIQAPIPALALFGVGQAVISETSMVSLAPVSYIVANANDLGAVSNAGTYTDAQDSLRAQPLNPVTGEPAIIVAAFETR